MPGVELQEAVRRAIEEIKKMYPEDILNDLLLEEIELAGNEWLVTLGFTRPSRMSSMARATGQDYGFVDPRLRDYKRIKIEASTGEFRGMTDRRLEESARS